MPEWLKWYSNSLDSITHHWNAAISGVRYCSCLAAFRELQNSFGNEEFRWKQGHLGRQNNYPDWCLARTLALTCLRSENCIGSLISVITQDLGSAIPTREGTAQVKSYTVRRDFGKLIWRLLDFSWLCGYQTSTLVKPSLCRRIPLRCLSRFGGCRWI